MRAVIWFLSLFASAVLLALVLGNHWGTVTLFWPPHRVDVSLNLFVLALLLGFVFFYAVVRGVRQLLAMPRRAHEWRQRRKERAMHRALLDAFSLGIGGRYVRARKAALQALERERAWQDGVQDKGGAGSSNSHAKLRALAHWQLAESAHALQDMALRDQHAEQVLAAAASTAQAADVVEGLQLRQVRWALDEREAPQALAQLQALPSALTRRSLALRLKLKAARLAQQPLVALDAARALVKHGAFSASAGQVLVQGLISQALQQCRTPEQAKTLSQQLSTAECAMPAVRLSLSEHWLALGGDAVQASAWLLPVWEQHLQASAAAMSNTATPAPLPLGLVRALHQALQPVSDDWLNRLERAAQHHPSDPGLHHLLGVACARRQLWGKAQHHLAQAQRWLPAHTLAANDSTEHDPSPAWQAKDLGALVQQALSALPQRV
jgi:HemY protein